MESTLRLFKALPIEERKKGAEETLLKETIKYGFVFAPEVVAAYPDHKKLIDLVRKTIGISPEQLNASFHKSWKKVQDASIEQLLIEQVLHYFTTYGFEELGIYNADSVYIPNEELDIPNVDEDIRLVIIKGYTKKELKEKLLGLLKSGVALGKDTMADVLDVGMYVDMAAEDVAQVRNKEVKMALYDYFGLFPKDPVDFLRFLVHSTTNTTLLIKNEALIAQLKGAAGIKTSGLLKQYEKEVGLEQLATIFYRFKPLFLALRQRNDLKRTINQIRRLAPKNHKPLEADYLNSLTGSLKSGKKITEGTLNNELEKVNIFRKIRVASALNFRTTDADSILYKIRNGKSYAKEFAFTQKAEAKKALDIVLDSIAGDIKKNVGGKKIYIPEYINYALPATEKQFTDKYPSGTYVSVPKDMVFGVNWHNTKGYRVDLDLSVITIAGEKIGWDESYRTGDRTVLFSGDITDAPGKKGATELFYVKKQPRNALLLMLNYFNHSDEHPVPFKIIVAQEEVKTLAANYTVDPNNVISVALSSIDKKQKILGLVVPTEEECRFYFTEAYLGDRITSSHSDHTRNAQRYLVDFYKNSLTLSDVLVRAGAELVTDPEDCDINLSPESLEKDTILNLLTQE
jgi:hypothetical protein